MAINRKINRKRTTRPKKSATPMNNSSLIKLIKKVTLKTQETKMATHNTDVFNINHNISYKIRNNMLLTSQGVADSLGVFGRIGDTVMPIGLKCYMTFRQPADRPNVTWKVWILRFAGAVTPPTFVPVKAITTNLMLDPIDTEQCSVIKVFTHKAKESYYNGTLGSSKEICEFKKIWLPLPKTQYTYSGDNSGNGKNYQYTLYVTAYDTLGTLLSDTIGSFQASCSFYFKDA